MSHGAWVKWASKNETPTTTDMCPECRGKGWTIAIEVAPGHWNYGTCVRCNGTGEIGAVIVKGELMKPELVKVTYEQDRNDFFKLQRSGEERDMSNERISASAMAYVEDEIGLTDQELEIAARVGVTRDEVLEQKAYAKLDPDEIRLMRAGLTAIEVFARRSVR